MTQCGLFFKELICFSKNSLYVRSLTMPITDEIVLDFDFD